MQIALLVIGVALGAFGALVLLKYSDSPGGSIKWLGAEVSSKGAGLPLIALGVACIVFAATRFPDRELAQTAPPVLPVYAEKCVPGFFDGIPPDRIDTVEVGMRDVEIIGSHEKQDTPFVLILTEGGQRIGGLRLRLYGGNTSPVYKIELAIDAGCADVTDMKNLSIGGNPRELQNWNTLRVGLGVHHYNLRIGGVGNTNVGYFIRAQ
ncbi:MAG: hypothetical protein JWL61_2659 [Gemmatimonadetes bacterium]|nr:hypothetical protein [Gemmatimonadota bacterium]